MPNKREKIIEVARSLIGVPFQHQGRSRKGIDCGGFVVYVMKEVGIPHDDVKRYRRRPNPKRFKEAILSCADQVPIGDVKPADFYWLWVDRKDKPMHIGIITALNRFIHAYAEVGKVTEDWLDDYWRQRINSAWRFKGVV